MKRITMIFLAALIAFLSLAQAVPTQAAEPVVRAVLFYSPTCGHCHKVITEDLPVIMEKYKEQFELLAIDVSNMSGSALYQAIAAFYKLPEDRLGVPALIISDIVLVGSAEIPEQLPGLIDQGLANGGVDWPQVPELLAAIDQYQQSLEQTGETPTAGDSTPVPLESPLETGDSAAGTFSFSIEGMRSAFLNDPAANTIAVIVLIGMLISLIAVGIRYLNGPEEPAAWLSGQWLIPVLALIGLGVAIYLSYSEIFGGEVVCGPLGQCESVQDSQYAKLFGFLHVGILGMVGYAGILLAWAVSQFAPAGLRSPATIALWGMAWFGVLFSVYLTFLEPFVIGATCMWCIASAIIMTLILWISNEKARLALHEEDDFEELVQAE